MEQNRSNFSQNEETNFFFNTLMEVSYYECFVTIPLGTIGNLISIFIFTRPSLNKKTNTGLLFTILCVLNLIIILYKAIFHWEILTKILLLHIDFNINQFLKREIENSLPWIQALISFDRFIAVFFPVKGIRLMNKRWILYSIIFGLLVFISSANSIHLIKYPSISTTNIKINKMLLLLIIDVLIKICIPCLIIVVFDLMVIVRLKRSKSEIAARQPTRRSKSSRFTINTIIIDSLFLIFNLPSISSFCISFKLSLDESKNITLALKIIELFSNIYSHLFFILFLIFNRIFRHEFISIFKRNGCFNNINFSSS